MALAWAFLGAFAILACVSYHSDQAVYLSRWFHELGLVDRADGTVGASNQITGKIGATYALLANSQLGYGGMFLLPAYALWLSYIFMFRRAHLAHWWKIVLMALALAAACGLADMVYHFTNGQPSAYLHNGYGGALGTLVYSRALDQPLGHAGSLILLSAIYVVCLLLIFTENPGQSLEWWLQACIGWRSQRAAAKAQRAEQEKQKALELAETAEKAAKLVAAQPQPQTRPVEAKSKTLGEEPDIMGPAKTLGAFKVSQPTLFTDGAREDDSLTPDEIKKLAARDDAVPAKLKLPRQSKRKKG